MYVFYCHMFGTLMVVLKSTFHHSMICVPLLGLLLKEYDFMCKQPYTQSNELISLCPLLTNALFICPVVVNFEDGKCKDSDVSHGDTIISLGTLCHGLYRQDRYEKLADDALPQMP